MKRFLYLLPLVLFMLLAGPLAAQTDKALREQRSAAQKARQDEKKARNQVIADATQTFREYTRALESEYQGPLNRLDTEFELKQVQLQAEKEARIAGAEVEFQKKWTALLFRPTPQAMADHLSSLEIEAKAYATELFRIKKEAAEIVHQKRMAVEVQKSALLRQMDAKAMQQAEALGLMEDCPPILATPIGGELTRPEIQWNQREERDVAKIMERNQQAVAKFLKGENLRAWERANLDADFQLAWDERRELHEIESRKDFLNTYMLQVQQGEAPDQQTLLDRLTEIAHEERLIKIKFDQARKENAIKRREERKQLVEN